MTSTGTTRRTTSNRVVAIAAMLALAVTLLAPSPAEARPKRQRSSVSLHVSSESVLVGQSVTFAGKVRPTRKMKRRTVKLQVRSSGAWRGVAKARAGRGGRYAIVVPMSRAGRYSFRAVATKNGKARSATSGTKVVVVSLQSSQVTASWPGGAARRTAAKVVTGTVSPAGTPRTVYLQRQVPGTWTTMSTATTTAAGGYRLALPTGVLGRWNLRVLVSATTALAAAEARKPDAFEVTPDWTAEGRAADHALLAPAYRWNPCSTIRYRVNTRDARPGALADVKQAVHRLSIASGLRFEYAGASRVIPQLSRQDFGNTDLMIAWATTKQSTYLKGFGWAAGVGGATLLYTSGYVDGAGRQVRHAFQGKVVLNSARNDQVEPGAGKGGTRVALLMHEIGHVVGLDHAPTKTQIMYKNMTAREDWWGNGDVAGLRRLGADQGCLYRAGTEPGGARTTERRVVPHLTESTRGRP